jgi:hypothetical protein
MRCGVTVPLSAARTEAKEDHMSGHRRHIAALLTLAVLFMSGILAAQSASVTIFDSNGNTAFGSVINGNVFFHDSNGHTDSGTIRDGNVFLSTDKGEITFGTVRGGNVFLNDSKGITTGTIRNGNIFLLNSDGSITTGSYDSYGNANTLTTTSSAAWRYSGSSACYSYGSTEQCIDQGALQRYVSGGQRQFEVGFATGQAIGGAIGGLVRMWFEHHQQVNLERKDLRQQIRESYDAAFRAADEDIRQQYALIDVYERLARLDPSRATMYEQAADGCRKLSSTLKKFRPMTEQNLPGILAAKDLKYLRNAADLSQKYYNLTSEGAKRSFVFDQLMEGWAGFFESQRRMPKPVSDGRHGS